MSKEHHVPYMDKLDAAADQLRQQQDDRQNNQETQTAEPEQDGPRKPIPSIIPPEVEGLTKAQVKELLQAVEKQGC